jgi:plastocyanin
MRYTGLVLAMSAVVLNACAGGDTAKKPDSMPAAQNPTPAATATPMPITSDTVTVRMLAEGTTFKFDPADVTVKPGGGIKFVVVSGQPHNVAFMPAELPADVKAQLNANMDRQTAELQSPLMITPGEVYVVSMAGVKPGKYNYDCPLHRAFNMKGTVTVQ